MARIKPVSIHQLANDPRRRAAVCECGWHGRERTHEGDAFRDAVKHRTQCPYRKARYY